MIGDRAEKRTHQRDDEPRDSEPSAPLNRAGNRRFGNGLGKIDGKDECRDDGWKAGICPVIKTPAGKAEKTGPAYGRAGRWQNALAALRIIGHNDDVYPDLSAGRCPETTLCRRRTRPDMAFIKAFDFRCVPVSDDIALEFHGGGDQALFHGPFVKHQMNSADLRVARKLLQQSGKLLKDGISNFLRLQGGWVVRVDTKPCGKAPPRIRLQHDQRRQEGPAVADDHDLRDQRIDNQRHLQVGRRHILAG